MGVLHALLRPCARSLSQSHVSNAPELPAIKSAKEYFLQLMNHANLTLRAAIQVRHRRLGLG